MLSHCADVLFVLFVATMAWCVGQMLMRLLRVEFDCRLEALVIGVACGLGLLAYAILAIGLLGWLTRTSLGQLLGLAGLLALVSLPVCLKLMPPNASIDQNPVTGLHRVARVLLMSILAITLLATLTPPTANDYDSLVYHLAAPKVYLARHRIEHLPYDHHSNFPFTMEMLYILGLGLKGAEAAKLFHFTAFALTLAALLLLGERMHSRQTGLCGALVFAATPVVFSEACTAYVDIGLAMFTVLAYYSLYQWVRNGKDNWWIPTALFSGWMMGTKYLGVVLFVPIVALALWSKIRHSKSAQPPVRTQHTLRSLMTMLLLTALIASPWYLKSFLWTGNPVYPFAYNIFGGSNWNAEMAAQYWAEQKSYGDRSLLGLLQTPWRLSFYPLASGSVRYEVEASLASAVGPLYLLFIVPLLFLPKKRDIKVILGVCAFLLLAWFCIMQYNRYLIPCLALLSLPTGYAVDLLQERPRWVRWTANASFLSIVLIFAGLNLLMNRQAIPAALGLISEQEYLETTLDNFSMCQWINTNLPNDARIITYGEPRGFYLDCDYLWGDPGHHHLIPYERIRTFDDLRKAWETLHVTHVLLNQKHFRLGVGGDLQRLIFFALRLGKLRLLHATRNGQFLLLEIPHSS